MKAYRPEMDVPMYANVTNEREDRELEAAEKLVLPALELEADGGAGAGP
jgi:hypothetical protein